MRLQLDGLVVKSEFNSFHEHFQQADTASIPRLGQCLNGKRKEADNF